VHVQLNEQALATIADSYLQKYCWLLFKRQPKKCLVDPSFLCFFQNAQERIEQPKKYIA